jgi:hypothetical protein
VLAVSALLLAACGREKEGAPSGPTTPAAPTFSPLTGLPLSDASIARRPAVTVKVDNAPEARPQSGLDKADVVIEEKVEGGITRFLAVFHSQDADPVGPVRSVRSTDAPLMAPIGGVFAFAGGIPPFVERIGRVPVSVVSEDRQADAFTLRPDRRRPFKTYASTRKLREVGGGQAKPPPRLFELLGPGEAFAPSGATPATRAHLAFAPRVMGSFDYDVSTGLWRRSTNGTPHAVEGAPDPLAFTNVVIQLTEYRTTPFRDASGTQVDEAVVVGSGEAIILSQGKQLRGKWSKTSDGSVITYTDGAGAPVRLVPGRTWVALPPLGAPITVT